MRYTPNPTPQPAIWWHSSPKISPARPLADLVVVDLTSILATTAVTRGLPKISASVMGITAEHLPNFSQFILDLGWGELERDLIFEEGQE